VFRAASLGHVVLFRAERCHGFSDSLVVRHRHEGPPVGQGGVGPLPCRAARLARFAHLCRRSRRRRWSEALGRGTRRRCELRHLQPRQHRLIVEHGAAGGQCRFVTGQHIQAVTRATERRCRPDAFHHHRPQRLPCTWRACSMTSQDCGSGEAARHAPRRTSTTAGFARYACLEVARHGDGG